METFEPVMLDKPEALPVYRFAFKIPPTVRLVRVPKEVMFDCAATVTL